MAIFAAAADLLSRRYADAAITLVAMPLHTRCRHAADVTHAMFRHGVAADTLLKPPRRHAR